MTTFWRRFDSICTENGTTPNAVAKKLHLSSGSVTSWKLNDVIPRSKTVETIADYFGVSVDFLLGKEKTASASDTVNEFMELINFVPEDELRALNAYLREKYGNH